MKKGINFQRTFTLAGIISLGLVYVLLWSQMIMTQSKRVGSDFMGLYSAARISKDHGFSFIYDVEMQIDIQSQVVGFQFPADQTSYFTHPPFIVLLVNLIADDNYTSSLIRWTVILLVLNGLTVFILIKSLAASNFNNKEIWMLAAGTFMFWPTFSGFMNGQDVMILLLGMSIWMLQLLAGNQIAAGLGLSLSAIRPQTAIMLSIPFLLRRQKVFLGLVIGGLALALISLGLIGSAGLSRYINILGGVERGLWYLPHSKDMPTISGFIRRNVETMDKGLFGYIIWSGYLTGVAIISVWWHKNKEIKEKHIGLLVLAGLIFVPYAHYHELALLLIPMFCLIRVLSAKNLVSSGNLVLFPLAVSLFLVIGFIGSGVLKYFFVYTTMFLLGYFLLFPERINTINTQRRNAQVHS